jgi:hypothetical protein
MSKFIQVSLLGLALAAVGCGGATPEMGPAKETPKMSPEEIQKKMMESANKNKTANGEQGTSLEVPAGEKKE